MKRSWSTHLAMFILLSALLNINNVAQNISNSTTESPDTTTYTTTMSTWYTSTTETTTYESTTFEPSAGPTSEPTVEPTIEPTTNPECMESDVSTSYQISYTIITAITDDLVSILSDSTSRSFKDTVTDIMDIFNALWCYLEQTFNAESTTTTRRRLLQDDTYQVTVAYGINSEFQSTFFDDDSVYDRTEFLEEMTENLIQNSIDDGIIDNEHAISGLELFIITTTPAPTAATPTTVTIQVTISSKSNSTNSSTLDIISDVIKESIIANIPGLTESDVQIEASIDEDGQILVTVTITTDSATASTINEYVEDEFTEDLEDKLDEEGIDYESIDATATISTPEPTDDGDEEEVDWLDPTTYTLINWIIVIGGLIFVCCIALFMMRCCWLCITKRGEMRRKKSNYQAGDSLFGQVSRDMSQDDAFHTDLQQAIEMRQKGNLLKKNTESLDLDAVDVNAAFDHSLKDRHSNPSKKKASKAGDKEQEKLISTKKNSEGALPNTTNELITPGGPGDATPPAPPAPTQEQPVDMDDYDLL